MQANKTSKHAYNIGNILIITRISLDTNTLSLIVICIVLSDVLLMVSSSGYSISYC